MRISFIRMANVVDDVSGTARYKLERNLKSAPSSPVSLISPEY